MSNTAKDTSDSNNKVTFGSSGRKIIYDEDGKPCRSCNTLQDFQLVTGKISNVVAQNHLSKASTSKNMLAEKDNYKQDPPDVEELGRSTWTFLHSVAAKYPKAPTDTQQTDMSNFINIFSKIYPCNWCAKDFEQYIAEHAPKVKSRSELGKWFCEAHNEVNGKLGKKSFDCNLWEKRWIDGWE